MHDSVHRFVRRLVGWYPWRTPSYELNVLFSWLGFDGDDPKWLTAQPRGDVPGIVLNVNNRYHRKNYYFLKAYYRHTCAQPLGRFLLQKLAPGGTFLDIGAHLGFYAFFAKRLVGDAGKVFAFEPDPITLCSLRGSAEVNANAIASRDSLPASSTAEGRCGAIAGRDSLPASSTAEGRCGAIEVRGIALSDHEGELPFYRASAQAHSLVPGAGEDARYTGEQFTVPVTTLDAWAAREQLDVTTIQAIKIDVEGAEAHTVAGGLAMFERAGLPPIWCEVRGPEGSTRAPNTFADVLQRLAPLGYEPFRWTEGGLVPVTVEDVRGREDIVFETRPR